MLRMLFIRDFKHRTGGHVTVRDYFLHSLAHPGLDPYVYFTPSSNMDGNDLWRDLPRSRFVSELRPKDYDLLFIGGDDWELLPPDLGQARVINVILHVRHATQRRRRVHLSRPALRICNSLEVQQAIAPLVTGVSEVIPNAVDFGLFRSDLPKDEGYVLIWGEKNPELANRLFASLAAKGHRADLLLHSVERRAFASQLSQADIALTLPNATEGFYRPALEAMACRCAVVCSDAAGNRAYAVNDETCLQPPYGDFEQHLAAIEALLGDRELRERLRERGFSKSREFTLEAQRRRYYDFLERHVF